MWHAAANGNAQLVERLLANKARFNRGDAEDFTPLSIACQEGNARCARLLLRIHADVDGAINRRDGPYTSPSASKVPQPGLRQAPSGAA